MENNQSAAEKQDNSVMKSVEQRACSRGRSDLMTKRLKNRERQRRYRARKRLEAERIEAEAKKSVVVEETKAVQAEPQPNGNHNFFVSRIYCKRDWKKDARSTHVPNHQEMNGSVDHFPTLPSVSEAACLAVENREIQPGSSSVVNNEAPSIVLSRRDWKAEARRKKN